MLFRRGGHNRSYMADIRHARQAAARGEDEDVVRRCRAAVAAVDAAGERPPDEALDALDEYVDLCSEVGRYDAALEALQRLARFAPDNTEIELDLAICYFELTEFERAAAAFEQLRADCDPHPEIEFYLGALAERREEWATADRHFQTAHRLDPANYPPLLTISDRRVDQLVRETLDSLPRDTYDVIRKVPVICDPVPPVELLRLTTPPFSPLILGMHHGADMRRGSVFHTAPVIDGIRLFPRNIAKVARTQTQFEHELTITLLHEIGHRLGLDEDEVWERGL